MNSSKIVNFFKKSNISTIIRFRDKQNQIKKKYISFVIIENWILVKIPVFLTCLFFLCFPNDYLLLTLKYELDLLYYHYFLKSTIFY